MSIISLLASQAPSPSDILLYGIITLGTMFVIHILSQLLVPADPKQPPVVFSAIPFLGSAIEFGVNPIEFIQKCQKKYGDVFTFTMVGKRVTVFLGADGNQFVFNSKQEQTSAAMAYNHMTKHVFGPEVVYDAPHKVFMEQKKFIKAGLNTERFRKHVPMIVEVTNNFLKEKFKKPSHLFDAYSTFGELIILTASRCLMGKEIHESLIADGTVAKLYYDLDQGFKPINFVFPNLPLPSYWRRDAARQKMADLYSSIVQKRREDEDTDNDDLVQAFMEAIYKDGTQVPDHHIAGMMIAVLFGGQHTSATTSAWTMLELADRPDLLEALRREQIEKLGSLDTDLTFENIQDLPLLEATIRETLRLHPPIYQMMRKVTAENVEYKKKGFVIPKGNHLCAVPGVTQVDPLYFNNPMKYDPERWIRNDDPLHTMEQGDDANVDYGFGAVGISSKSPFLPFGAGRHRCIGEQFGYLQLKTIISTMVRTFDISLEKGKSVPKPDYTSMVVVPEHPSNIQCTWRS